jgi:hypothetical protein
MKVKVRHSYPFLILVWLFCHSERRAHAASPRWARLKATEAEDQRPAANGAELRSLADCEANGQVLQWNCAHLARAANQTILGFLE